MASILDKIPSQIYAGFKGKLRTGVLYRNVRTGVNEYNDPIYSETEYAIQGFEDNFSDVRRALAGIPATDVQINIFAASTTITPQKDDEVRFTGSKRYKLRDVQTDPASALWTSAAFEVAD